MKIFIEPELDMTEVREDEILLESMSGEDPWAPDDFDVL